MLEVLTLIENLSSSPNLSAEHGLSIYVKQDNEHYLIDTGASGKFIENAEKLGVNLKCLNGIIISHNHADHIGGLPALLQWNKKVKVYIKSAAINEYYLKVWFVKKYIGEEKGLFDQYKDRFIFIKDEMVITNKFKLLSNSMDDKKYLCKANDLLMKKQGKYQADDYKHELFAVFEEKNGLVLISSCSHNGIVNIVNTVKEKYQNKPILNIIGGFHMMGFGIRPLNCSQSYINMVADVLDQACDNKIYTCHCTGEKAFHIMRERLGDKITYLKTGHKVLL